jgi:hypothetical protein
MDPELARLVADMSVTQTPARRNGGVWETSKVRWMMSYLRSMDFRSP